MPRPVRRAWACGPILPKKKHRSTVSSVDAAAWLVPALAELTEERRAARPGPLRPRRYPLDENELEAACASHPPSTLELEPFIFVVGQSVLTTLREDKNQQHCCCLLWRTQRFFFSPSTSLGF